MSDSVRIDRWLWAARLFKTRGLAKAALDGGKVDLNGQRAKPSKAVKPGDILRVSREDFRLELEVLGLSDRRLGAALAAELYQESEASAAAREEALARRRERRDAGRPDKRSRRLLKALKGIR
ncbi:MAG: RNA-binding S4 domain-containing protein [Pseudomonadota bacterium]